MFEKSFTVPVGANIIGYDTSLPVNGSVNSLELSKTGGSVIYLFYTPEVDKVYYTVNRYMVLSDKVTQIEVDKNGNPIYRDANGNVYTDAALTTAWPTRTSTSTSSASPPRPASGRTP